MTVYVLRNGRLIDKATLRTKQTESLFPTPRISRFDAYVSPVSDKEVTSWRQRDREMNEHDCFDTRDLAPDHQWRRGREVQMKELEEVRADAGRTEDGFEWTDTTA